MTFYQDQKRRKIWTYISVAFTMPRIREEPLHLLSRIATFGWKDPITAPRCFGSEMRPFNDSCVGQRSCVYSTSRLFVFSCPPALLL